MSARIDPGLGESPKGCPVARRRGAAFTGCPAPTDKTVFRIVLLNASKVFAAIAFGIFKLLAHLSTG